MQDVLAGKVAMVTGAAGGIGRATAELFVASGAAVVLADIDAERGEEVAGTLGESAAFKRADVADPEQVQALVDVAVARFGGLQVLRQQRGYRRARSSVSSKMISATSTASCRSISWVRWWVASGLLGT